MKLKQLIALEILVRNEGCLQQELGATLMVDPNNCVLLLNELDDPATSKGSAIRRTAAVTSS